MKEYLNNLKVGNGINDDTEYTHDRRMEVYMHLDMGENDAVFRMMGEPNETRHIIMHNEEEVFYQAGQFIRVLAQRIIHSFGQCAVKI